MGPPSSTAPRRPTLRLWGRRAYGGAWEEVLIGVRESFGVQILKERYADTGEIGLLCHARVDVGMGRAAKMGRIINLSAS